MGCISTIITDSRRRTAVKHRPNPRRSPSEKAPAAAAAAASTGSEEDEPGRGDQVEERPQPLPAAPFIRNQQGWPPWLVAAVGDAIGEFVPRCADTFQKLDKVPPRLLCHLRCTVLQFFWRLAFFCSDGLIV